MANFYSKRGITIVADMGISLPNADENNRII